MAYDPLLGKIVLFRRGGYVDVRRHYLDAAVARDEPAAAVRRGDGVRSRRREGRVVRRRTPRRSHRLLWKQQRHVDVRRRELDAAVADDQSSRPHRCGVGLRPRASASWSCSAVPPRPPTPGHAASWASTTRGRTAPVGGRGSLRRSARRRGRTRRWRTTNKRSSCCSSEDRMSMAADQCTTHGPIKRLAAGTGWSHPTAASSPSTRRSTARPATCG